MRENWSSTRIPLCAEQQTRSCISVLEGPRKVFNLSSSSRLHSCLEFPASARPTSLRRPHFRISVLLPQPVLLHSTIYTTLPPPQDKHNSIPHSRPSYTTRSHTRTPSNEAHKSAAMDQTKELLEMPREFLKDGRQFVTRCSKRMPLLHPPRSRTTSQKYDCMGYMLTV